MEKYWEGAAVFPATGTEVEYFVDAGPDGVTDANRRSLATIVSNYDALLDQARAVVETLEPDDRPRGLLRLSSVDIPGAPLEAASWELGFCDADEKLFSVLYSGLTATGLVEKS
ncbi:hypothetical protein QFW80_14380 [Luteimonas sp. M1R5S18]|uniref:Uncharacterized protein n=1 Tax=Luteimonas rhizosphaericola TaxID=3042024 RepID=A0ABT6JNQ1_9GAMM|nr:hypothetical protein [Luteimonas rhizosphaericola]MDH5831706.1 hypothetical protein [Luteimonas rhizosphaericola]